MIDYTKKKLVIFDMDGTSLNTLDDLSDTMNYALEKHQMPLRKSEEIRGFVGNGIHRLVELSVPADTEPEETERVYQDFMAHYKEHCNDKTRPFAGIPELMKKLKEHGRLTALVSNKADYNVQLLDAQYFNGLLDIGVGERKGIARKPSADMVNAVLSELHVDRKDAVYIGDTEVDLKTAANAGMDCISVLWGYRSRSFLEEHGAVCLVKDAEELGKVLLGE